MKFKLTNSFNKSKFFERTIKFFTMVSFIFSNISWYDYKEAVAYSGLYNNSRYREVGGWETSLKSMTVPRSELSSAVVDDKLYVIGGYSSSRDGTVRAVEMYDPYTDTWQTKRDMPTERSGLQLVSVGNKIYAIGGINGVFTNAVEMYDTTNDTWYTKTPIPTSRHSFASAVVGSKIYCIGGVGSNGLYLNSVEVYDTVTNRWEVKSPISSPRGYFSAEAIGNKIYCVGGYDDAGNSLSTLEIYDTITDTWYKAASSPTKRYISPTFVLGNEIYVVSGYNQNGMIYDIDAYNILTNTWAKKGEMVSVRSYFTGRLINGTFYCAGGWQGSGAISTLEGYVAKLRPEEEAERAVEKAESSNQIVDINNARDLVNKLPSSQIKENLQTRLNNIDILDEIDLSSMTANSDIYIKPKNKLSISLDTNYVVFEDYVETEDMEKLGAMNLTVSSSLPYDLNAYMPVGIENADGTASMSINTLNIRESSETSYKRFSNLQDKIILKDTCPAGRNNNHSIDLKLSSSKIHKNDVYRTVIKFEVQQK